jgi:hypothetical protein
MMPPVFYGSFDIRIRMGIIAAVDAIIQISSLLIIPSIRQDK